MHGDRPEAGRKGGPGNLSPFKTLQGIKDFGSATLPSMKSLLLAFLIAFSMDPTAQAAVPGQGRGMTAEEYLVAAGMKVDKNFSSHEKHELARALDKVPACLREKARGLKIRRVTGVEYYGQRTTGTDHIRINPKHYVLKADMPADYYDDQKNGAFVHEIFHVIGEWNKEYYYKAYLALDPEGSCPVSEYGAKTDVVEEDFAEAARLLFVPETRDDRYQDKCVDEKLAALKKIFAACK